MNCVLKSWRDHESELRGYLIRQVNDKPLAEDLLQDVFIRAIVAGAGFCKLENPRAWLFAVARNHLVDHLRKHKISVEVEDIGDQAAEVDALVSLSGCLPRALQNLSEEDRDVVTQCDLEGMNQAEYAQMHKLGLPAIKSRIQRARRRLKQQLQTNCQVRFDENGKVCCFLPKQYVK